MRNGILTLISVTTLVVLSGCSRPKEIRTVSMGEKAEIGSFTYQAIETHWPMSLEGRTAKDRFFLVRISVLNTGGNQETIPGLEVVDDAGNSFPEVADGGGVADWLGVSRRLAAANSQVGVVIFDVPPKHYRLRVADDADNFMFIDIPLNLNSEEPESKKIEGLTPLK